MGRIVQLQNKKTGENEYPRTYTKAIIDDQATPLDTLMQNQNDKIAELGSEVYSKTHGKNLFNKDSVVKGYFINIEGKPSSNENYFYSEIPVKPNTIYHINKEGVGGCYSVLDQSKNALLVRKQVVGAVEIPENGYYLVVSSNIVNLDSLQVEEGDKETVYEEFNNCNSWYDWYKYAKLIIGGEGKSYVKIESHSYSDGFLSKDGTFVPNSGFVVTDFIELPFSYAIITAFGIFSNPYGGGVCFYDENKKFLSSVSSIFETSENNLSYVITDIPINAKYIRSCAIKKGLYETAIIRVSDDALISKLIKKTEENTSQILRLGSEVSLAAEIKSKNLFNKNDVVLGKYFDFSGKIQSNESYFCSDFISVKANSVYYINKDGVGGGYVIYDNQKNIVFSAEQKKGAVTILDNGCYLRVSTRIDYLNSLQIEEGYKETTYEEYYSSNIKDVVRQNVQDIENIHKIHISRIYKKESFADSISNGDFIEIPNTPNLKNKHTISFHANVTTMGKLRISHGTDGYIAGIFEVDDTNIYVYSGSKPTTIKSTIPHGLNISEYIHIHLRVSNAYHKGDVIVSTYNGQSFSTKIEWNGCSLNATVNCLSGSYSMAKLIFGGNAWKEKVWIFGDSYTDFWPAYMEKLQATNYLLDGYSGRGSTGAYSSFINELEYGVPSVIIWMMGMNDADTSDAINSYYKTNFDKMKLYCDSQGILFVPCTIPNVPDRIHIFKNQYIKDNSEYYIDMAKVLGAEDLASSWYSGLLGDDKVHPSEAGAILIAQTLCEEMPQILND